MPRRLVVALVAVTAACGGATSDAPQGQDTGAPVATTTREEVDACAVLRAVDLPGIAGAAPESVTEGMRTANDDGAVSQCVAAFPGVYRTVSLIVRLPTRGANPASKADWVSEVATGSLGMPPATADAATQVEGLGDLALHYDMDGSHLAVYWKERRQLLASSVGFDDPAVARQTLEAIARETLARY